MGASGEDGDEGEEEEEEEDDEGRDDAGDEDAGGDSSCSTDRALSYFSMRRPHSSSSSSEKPSNCVEAASRHAASFSSSCE